MKAVCYTGHRPEKLFKDRSNISIKLALLKRQLRLETERAIAEGYTEFITGMARGTDIFAAEIVLRLKQQHPNLRLVCILPYPEQGKGFSDGWRYRHNAILEQCDESIVACPAFSRASFVIRNRMMVERADRVIAVYNGSGGGTAGTIAHAQSLGKEVITIAPNALYEQSVRDAEAKQDAESI